MQSKFEQLLDYLVNEETEKAEELFHEIVVEKSRNIYENLIAEEEKSDDDEDADKDEDKQVDEMFDEVEEESVIEIGGDPADDLVGDVEFGDDEGAEDDMGSDDDMGGMEGDDLGSDDGQDERIDDLEDALADLKAEFEKLMSGEEGDDMGGDDDMGDDEGDMDKDEDEEDFLREYVDKVADGHGAEKKGAAEKAGNTKSPNAGENRMGGTAFKLGQGDEKGGVKGGLVNPSPKDMSTGNVNVKGGTSAKQFYSKDSKGHGAEKSGAGESNVNAKSPLAPSHAK
jgi:hypothetical protein